MIACRIDSRCDAGRFYLKFTLTCKLLRQRIHTLYVRRICHPFRFQGLIGSLQKFRSPAPSRTFRLLRQQHSVDHMDHTVLKLLTGPK